MCLLFEPEYVTNELKTKSKHFQNQALLPPDCVLAIIFSTSYVSTFHNFSKHNFNSSKNDQ